MTISFTSSEPLALDGNNATHVRLGWSGSGYPYEATYLSNSGSRYTYELLAPGFFYGSLDLSIEPFDIVGNYGWFTADDVLFVDTYQPWIENIAATPHVRRVGDDVTITFDITDTVPTSPTVTVDGDPAVCVSHTYPTWTYRYTVGAGTIDRVSRSPYRCHGPRGQCRYGRRHYPLRNRSPTRPRSHGARHRRRLSGMAITPTFS